MFLMLRGATVVLILGLAFALWWGISSQLIDRPILDRPAVVSDGVLDDGNLSSRFAESTSSSRDLPSLVDDTVGRRDSETQTISGQVIRALDGKPISEFKLLLVEGSFHLSMEDNFRFYYPVKGKFTLDLPTTEQPLALHVRAVGYRETIVPVGHGDSVNYRVALESEFIVHGRVVDQAGVAVPDALIFEERIPTKDSNFTKLAIARSNAEGAFSLAGLRKRELDLCAYREGYSSDRQAIRLKHHSTSVELVLEEGGVLAGTCTLDGAPIHHAVVHGNLYVTGARDPLGEGGSDFGRMQFHTGANPRGEFRIEGLPNGRGVIQAGIVANGMMRDMVVNFELAPGLTTRVDFPFMSGGSSVEGYIYDGVDPAAGVQSRLTVDTGDYTLMAFVDSDETGYYQYPNLPAGTTTVSVYSQEGTKYSTGGLGENERLQLDLRLNGGAVVECVVHDAPIGEVLLAHLLPASVAIPGRVDRLSYGHLLQMVSGEAVVSGGVARFENVDDGKYSVLIVSHAYREDSQIDYASMRFASTPVTVEGEQGIDVEVDF